MLLRPHVPQVRVHRSKVTENVNLSVCTFVCGLMFSVGGFFFFFIIYLGASMVVCVCVSEMSVKFEMHL